MSALRAMPDPGPSAGPPIPVNPRIWVREPGSGGHVVLKAMGVIVAAIALFELVLVYTNRSGRAAPTKRFVARVCGLCEPPG